MTYQFDHEWEQERGRLEALEAVFDEASQRSILATRPQRGWCCLEVGAGAGSMAKWLCEIVGPEGHVIATDVETKFLDEIDVANLEVRKHNITVDPLEEATFDLIHSRAVLDHLPERDVVLQRLLAALRPGGWLALDGGDFASVRAVSADQEAAAFFDEGFAKVIDASRVTGFDPEYGRRLGMLFREAGLANVSNEGVVFEWDATHALAQLYSMTFVRLRDPVVGRGVLGAAEFDRLIAMMTTPSFIGIGNTVFTARGKRIAA